MKKILYSFILLLIANCTIAGNVNPSKAQLVGLNFLHSQKTNTVDGSSISQINLIYSELSGANGVTPYYYIFAAPNNKGFVIVSGDDDVTPILGYSLESPINISNLPEGFRKWMENDRKQITYVRTHAISATDKIKTSWDNLYTNTIIVSKSINSVNPLCTTTWDQGNSDGFYNASCPADASLPDANNISTHCVTGCPATAMAQIMKFWNYPTQGSGIHSYNHPTYGTLSANFGSTTYNWASMPNNLSSSNSAVATLMYHCGVAVEMNYSPDESGGYVIINSPTPTANCEYAYKTYFGYDPTTVQGVERVNYTDVAWKNLLKTDLNAGKPIQYAGFGTNGGHTFVCDGYDVSDNFHMNWGWSGNSDGFFGIDALNPAALGAGGGAGGFNADQQAVIGIHPSTIIPTSVGLALYSTLTVTPNPVGFYSGFTANVDIVNNGTATFNGDFTAALFDANYNFVDYVQTLSGETMAPATHYVGGLNFTTAGILTIPGNYYVGIFSEVTGGTWNLIDNGAYSNLVPLTIQGPVNADNMETYSAFAPTPTAFVQGQAASVDVNIANFSISTFTGTYSVDLYDLQGNFVETVGQYNETVGLPASSDYTNPLTFSSASITALPGTYYLVLSEVATGGSAFTLAGGTYFTNPVFINVVAPALTPDMYESNNTFGTAYTLPLSFAGNTATVNTSGSNNHIGTDIDFYNINLAAGYTYQITARLQDSYSNNDGNTYTQDEVFSYDTTGTGFSLAFDDILPSTINVNGASTVTFQASAYFPGTTGTYRLDISVLRTPTVGIENVTNNMSVSFYPNPASETISFKLNQLENKVTKLDVYNNMGQLVKSQSTFNNNTLDISELSQGMYFVSLTTSNGIVKSKFNVVK